MKALSIVIPAYQEAAAIQAGKLSRVRAWGDAQEFPVEVVVVDDGSSDGTARLAKEHAHRVVEIAHAGKSAAIVAGIYAAQGDIVLVMDMDQATPIKEAGKLLAVMEEGSKIAIGSRGMVRAGAPAGRYLLSWGQVALRSLLIGLRLADTQCGFKAFDRQAAVRILESLHVYHPDRCGEIKGPSVTSGFDVEFLFVAQRLGYWVAEVPVVWHYENTRRVSLLRDALRGVRDLFAILSADLRGKYPRAAGLQARGVK